MVENIVNTKSELCAKHSESLHMSLNHLEMCERAVEVLRTKSAIAICAGCPEVMQRIGEVEAEWASLDISYDSFIPVTVHTCDILVALDRSCHVGGPSAPRDVEIGLVEHGVGFDVSWGESDVGENDPEVRSYLVEVRKW